MTETIKIYRKKNKRLGFQTQNVPLVNLCIDSQALKRLIEHINSFYYICEDGQSEALLKATIDPSSSLITIISISLIAPIIKSLLFESFQYIVWEYTLIFLMGIFLFLQEFKRCDQMRDKYETAEEQRNNKIQRITEDFNSRFDHLKMSFDFGVNENQQGFLQINFFENQIKQEMCGEGTRAEIMAENK